MLVLNDTYPRASLLLLLLLRLLLLLLLRGGQTGKVREKAGKGCVSLA
jgi:hypothetical protein